jgi:hypothetical protein
MPGDLLHSSFGYVTVPKATASDFKLFKLARYLISLSRDHARAGRHGRDPRRGADGDHGPGRDAHDADDHDPNVDARPRYHALHRGRFPRLDSPAPGPVRLSPGRFRRRRQIR